MGAGIEMFFRRSSGRLRAVNRNTRKRTAKSNLIIGEMIEIRFRGKGSIGATVS
jgi:hypothetical protein